MPVANPKKEVPVVSEGCTQTFTLLPVVFNGELIKPDTSVSTWHNTIKLLSAAEPGAPAIPLAGSRNNLKYPEAYGLVVNREAECGRSVCGTINEETADPVAIARIVSFVEISPSEYFLPPWSNTVSNTPPGLKWP